MYEKITVIFTLIEGRETKVLKFLRDNKFLYDELLEVKVTNFNIAKKLSNAIYNAKHNWIVLPHPYTRVYSKRIINKFKQNLKEDSLIFTSHPNYANNLTINPNDTGKDIWLCFQNNNFELIDDNITSIQGCLKNIITQYRDIPIYKIERTSVHLAKYMETRPKTVAKKRSSRYLRKPNQSPKKYIEIKDAENLVHFCGRYNGEIKGSCIQSNYKKRYFHLHNKTNLKFNYLQHNKVELIPPDSFMKKSWIHVLFPHQIDKLISHDGNFSIGPNIGWCKQLGSLSLEFNLNMLRNRYIVADSEWNKEAIIHCFGKYINKPERIHVIPVYIGQHWNKIPYTPRNKFTVGMVGYFSVSPVKNLHVITEFAKKRPDWNFEVIINFGESRIPQEIKRQRNIKIFSQKTNEEVAKIAKNWSCYLGISMAERGPATIQEMNVMGVPTVCANHTGYKSFSPLIPLELKAFKHLQDKDKRMVYNTLVQVYNERDKILKMAKDRKEEYWQERTPEVITKKWMNFFTKCKEGR